MEKVAGIAHAGAASGLYWGFASAGSVALVWLFSEIAETWSWQAGAVAMIVLLVFNQAATHALPHEARGSALDV